MPRQSRIFRVFVSSTFGDLKAEREALQQQVYPRLRDLCQQHGCRFQAIDLRWGVSEEAALDQQTMNICLDELRRCQRTTPRPNFILLLGQRYGWRPLPPQIPAREFRRIEQCIPAASDRALLARWYRCDDNAVPPQYCLEPRAGRYGDGERWTAVESRLHSLLKDAARRAKLPQPARFKFEASATHQEIEAGALQTEKPARHVFAFFRTIQGLPPDAKEFLDLDANGKPDHDAQQRLQELKKTLRTTLPANRREYVARWKGKGVGASHLDALCADVFGRLSRVIREEIKHLEKADPLEEERGAHDAFAVNRTQHFTGRVRLLHDIRKYVLRGGSRPLVLHGQSGCGKSAIMAKASIGFAQEPAGGRRIARFIGATPATTEIRSLLESLCREIGREYGQDEGAIPGEYQQLIETFKQRLALATAEKPLVLFLDALDQLSDADRARNLLWLPVELPLHVRLIVSTLPGECLSILEKKLPRRSLIEVRPLAANEGEELLGHWLAEAQRTLQPKQRAAVLRGFQRDRLPLYLKLAFEEARRWKSWSRPARTTLPVDVRGIIDQLFDRLSREANHGPTLVSHGLGYLAAARNGLTEDELLDVFARDRRVLEDFKRRSPKSPAVAVLPFVVWSRLYSDLEPYLTQRSGDGASLLSFYHRQLGEQAAARCLSGADKKSRHRALAEFFAVPAGAQPNRRTISELAWQQTQSGLWRELEGTLTGLTFLEAKCLAGATYDLVADFNAAAAADLPGRVRGRINQFARFIKANAHVLARRPALLFQQATNEPDRSAPGLVTHRPLAAKRDGAHWLRWINKPQTPSPCLMVLVGHLGDINGCDLSPDGTRLVSAGRDQAVRVWNAATGTELLTMFGHRTPIATCAFSPDGTCVASGGYDGSLKLWDPQTGAELAPLAGHKNQIEFCTFARDGQRLLSAGNDNLLRIWDVRRRKQIVALPMGETTTMACAFSPDGRHFVSGDQRGKLTLWDGQKYRRLHAGIQAHAAEIMGCFFSPDGKWIFSASEDKTFKRWNADLSGEPLTFSGHTASVWAVAVSRRTGLIASASSDQTARLWDPRTGAELASLSGHTDGVLTCAFLPGDRLVTSSWDSTIRMWDVSGIKLPRGKLRATAPPAAGAASGDKIYWLTCGFSPDGSQLVAGSENDVRLWDAATGSLRHCFGPHVDYVRNAQFSPDGRWLLSSAAQQLARWEINSGSKPKLYRGHRNLISGCHISPDGTQILSSSEDHTLQLRNADGNKPPAVLLRDAAALTCSAAAPDWTWAAAGTKDGRLQIVTLPAGKKIAELQAHAGEVTTVAVSPDGRRLATGSMDRLVKIRDAATLAEIAVLDDHTASIRHCVFSPDGRTLATLGGEATMMIWDTGNFRRLRTIVGHSTTFQMCGYSPDGTRIISGSYDGTLRLWNPATGAQLAMLSGFRDTVAAVNFSPDGRRFVSASHFRQLEVRDGTTGRELLRLNGHEAEVRDCTFSPDSKRIASASADATLRLWSAATGECERVLHGHAGPVQSCAFSPDGERLISASWDRTLKLWNVRTGREIAALTGHDDWVQCALFSPEGRRIASAGLDRTIRLWNSAGQLQTILTGHQDAVDLCTFSTDGKKLLSGSGDATLKLWDTGTGKQLLNLTGHSAPIRACALSRDGRRAASASMDRTLRLWNLQRGTGVVLGEHESWLLCCAFSPDGRWLVSGGNDNFVKLWNATTQELAGEYWAGASVRCLRWHPSARAFVVGDEEGGIQVLEPATK